MKIDEMHKIDFWILEASVIHLSLLGSLFGERGLLVLIQMRKGYLVNSYFMISLREGITGMIWGVVVVIAETQFGGILFT